MVSRILLCCVGVVLWLAVVVAVFQIAHSRQVENELFDRFSSRAEGTIVGEFIQSSIFPIGRCFRSKACFVICSYSTEKTGSRQSVAEVGPAFFEYYPVGRSVTITYLTKGPNLARVMIPEIGEYNDLHPLDLFGLGLLNLIVGTDFFAFLIGRVGGLISEATAKNVSVGALLPSLFLILILLALRQGW